MLGLSDAVFYRPRKAIRYKQIDLYERRSKCMVRRLVASETGDSGLFCANVYGLSWRKFLRAMMECAALFSFLNKQSCEDCFAPQVSRAPGSTVGPSHC